MNTTRLIGSALIILILTVSGCMFGGSNLNSAPGAILGADDSDDNTQRIVTFDVIGKGLEPENALTKGEAKLMAERAAIADGYRQMVEKIRGVYVDAYMKAGYGKVDQDQLTTKTQSWLRGVDVVEIREAQYGITEAHMKLSVFFAKKNMVWWPTGIGPRVEPTGNASIYSGS